jgi:citrate synthase
MFSRVVLHSTRSNVIAGTRAASGATNLEKRMSELIPKWNHDVKEFRAKHDDASLGTTTVKQAFTGMKGIKCMIWETSLLDAHEGIKFRGLSIPECQQKLPKADGGEQPLPEALLYLLLTGEIPTKQQTQELSHELFLRSDIPKHTKKMIAAFPKNLHPMSQFAAAILSLQSQSKFSKHYSEGTLKKADYWRHTLDDALTLIAQLPTVAAGIYRHTFEAGTDAFPALDPNKDYSANFCDALDADAFGKNKMFVDLMRMYLTIHADHEGGNVSAHSVHLVGSALSDPFYSFAAGMCGLAGPLHGLANQECLVFQRNMMQKLGKGPYTKEGVTKATWDVLNSGQVVPGFGHAVLRKTDPRYMCQREFALKHMPNDPLFQLVSVMFEVIPTVLTEHGKTANPFPNVDAHSGCLLQHYGLTAESFYTVLFGVSRAIGTLSQLVIDRGLGFAIERPKSVTMDWLKANVK